VHPARPKLRQRAPVLRRPVAPVAFEPVVWVGLGEGAHRVVAHDLGDHAGRRDRRALRVGLGEALYVRAKRQVAVGEPAPCVRFERRESTGQGLAVCPAYAVAVDPPGREGHDGDGRGAAQQRYNDLLPEIWGQRLGVVYAKNLAFAEDDGGRDERASQGAAARLIGPGKRPAAAKNPGSVEGVERTLPGWRGSRQLSGLLRLLHPGLLAHLVADVVELRAPNGAAGGDFYLGDLR